MVLVLVLLVLLLVVVVVLVLVLALLLVVLQLLLMELQLLTQPSPSPQLYVARNADRGLFGGQNHKHEVQMYENELEAARVRHQVLLLPLIRIPAPA